MSDGMLTSSIIKVCTVCVIPHGHEVDTLGLILLQWVHILRTRYGCLVFVHSCVDIWRRQIGNQIFDMYFVFT